MGAHQETSRDNTEKARGRNEHFLSDMSADKTLPPKPPTEAKLTVVANPKKAEHDKHTKKGKW